MYLGTRLPDEPKVSIGSKHSFRSSWTTTFFEGVGELDQDKLPELIELKYNSIIDAVSALGAVTEIREVFIGFQEHLYS